jgi:hypothetical protein
LWRVPNDLKVGEKGETFTITVTYETHTLYGRVTGTRQVRIERP